MDPSMKSGKNRTFSFAVLLLCLFEAATSFVFSSSTVPQRTTTATSTTLTSTLVSLSSATKLNMGGGWHQTWKNILVEGGSKRWKVDDRNIKQQALATIQQYVSSASANKESLNILCPLAGDDPFVHEAWTQGHSVTSIDLVPEAVDAMREQFNNGSEDEGTWTKDDDTAKPNTVVWKHSSGRATLYVGDMLQKRPELNQQFDVVYDKDSFGALDKDMRQPFCERIAEFLKDDGIVYTEVKYKANPESRMSGPPFHVEKDDLMESTSFGNTKFDYVDGLGSIYDLSMPGISQTAHILKRTPRS